MKASKQYFMELFLWK